VNYLLDTNVLSEVRRPQPDAGVLAWLDQIDEDRTFLSVVSIAEIARGVAIMPEGAKRSELGSWLEHDLSARFAGRLIELDGATALVWGQYMGYAKSKGFGLSVMDGWIAASAAVHGLTLVTRNVRDFENLSIGLFNPWQSD
jgi:predicted nucleic acid-binding protein